MNIAVIDIIFMVVIAISALRCTARGFISELLAMAALIFGLLSAIFFYRQGAVIVREMFLPDAAIIPEVTAFAVLFLVVFTVIKILEITMKNIIEGIQLGSLDRVLGFVFGCAQGIVIVCLFVFLIYIQPFVDSDLVLGNSFCAKLLMPLIMGNRQSVIESVFWFKAPGELQCLRIL